MLDALVRDARHAVRSLARNPGYALVFIVTLGLGIGANTAMFSAVHGVLLRPLPHEDGDRLVYLRHSAPRADIANVLFSVPEIEDYRQGSDALAEIAEFSALDMTVLGLETPRIIRVGIVTGNYFDVMGLSAKLGRAIGPEDDGPDAPAVIVLTDRYWRSAFGADPGIIGRTVEISGRTATIVGVAEPAPPYPEQTDIYVNLATSPHHLSATMQQERIHRMTEVFARLAPGATIESARAEVATITARVQAEYPEAYDPQAGHQVTVTPLKAQLTKRARPTLLLLSATALAVLIIACANLGNLTLTRVLRRDHELAIRVSLGGSKWSLRRGLLVESLVLASVGTLLGLLIATWGLDLLVAFLGRFTSRASEIALDAPVFAFATLVAVAASLFFAVLPPLPDAARGGGTMLSGTRSTVGRGARRAQRALVVAQIGTSFVLLIAAGLLLRTMMHLNRVDPGFDTQRILTMDIPVDFQSGRSPADIRNQYLSILDSVRALPPVRSAALTNSVPLSTGGIFTFRMPIEVEGHEPAPGAPTPQANFRVVSPDYFRTMGIDLRGRDFTTTDVPDAQKVVVINESMARAYFGERDPIGQRVAWTDPLLERYLGVGPEMRTVVGVAADTRDRGFDAEVAHTIYNPYPQVGLVFSLVMRVTGDPTAVVPPVRRIVRAHDPTQPIENVATMEELGSELVAPRRLNTILLGAFAALALVIAAVGIGGVLAFSVEGRTREFGVKSALGAARRQIWSGVLAEGALLAAIGFALGGVMAVALTRFIAGLLVGVPPLDPVTFVAAAVVLGGVAMGAVWVPAWRAATVSPVEALTAE